ncbi:MAG TPA: aldehyde dehydrogenase family protein [Candidatus Dormibacteraeota bacterium]|nr:aldehyde dehydrogenase family protein [Candidatus Dormibacteraeota bacterium]
MTETATAQPQIEFQDRDRLFIGGAWVPSEGQTTIEVISSSTEAPIGRVVEGTAGDVDRAVTAARAAFPAWSETPPAERADGLDRIQQGLRERRDELVRLVAAEVGIPVGLALPLQIASVAYAFKMYAAMIREYAFEETAGSSLVLREAVGVVGAITPWNYPLHQIALKVAPALAAGCTVVLKPSEVTPLNAFVLAEVIEAAGLPAGVFNLVTGTGPVVGEAIAAHPEVDMVSFTGSTRAGKRVSELAAQTVKRVTLELGGKSANVILDDADLDAAVRRNVQQVLNNTGQSCNAWSRMLVPRAQQEEAARIAAEVVAEAIVGDPFAAESTVGPLASDAQRQRVVGYIRKGQAEGARLVAGGPEAPAGLERGYYVRPTVFADVTPEMTIAQEEIFGPVIAIMPYDTEEDAIRIANDTVYGLAGAVWSADEARAKRVARKLRTGQVDINGGQFNMMAPFGGYKQSGNGRELGRFGLEEFLEVKSLQL